MLRKIKIQLGGIRSSNDKVLLETEIDVLEGVKDINVDEKTSDVWIEFDDDKISQHELFQAIEKLGFQIKKEGIKNLPALKEHTYFVQGMHCASCEVLIEKKLSSLEEIESVEASAAKGRVLIEYKNNRPSPERLNRVFHRENYSFSDYPGRKAKGQYEGEKNNTPIALVIAGMLILGFLLLQKMGIANLVNVNAKSSLLMFLGLGLMAGISSCAALVGGLVLSMSKQWLEIYSEKNSFWEKLQPHLMFNVGRAVSYTIMGGVLGLIGSKLQISLKFTSFLILAVSVLMILLGLQMLGLKKFRRFQFTMPRFITRYVADESNFKGRYMPLLMGGATFLLPCGFTITAQGLALISGNALQGALIMLAFALGTFPMLLIIGVSSIKFSQKPHLSYTFGKIAGLLVLFFALYNINAQLNVLGFSSFSDIAVGSARTVDSQGNGLPEVANGKQVIKMQASASGYRPNYFKVRAGVPVRWEITDTGTSGCTNAVISRGLFSGEIPLTPGETSVKEFTPKKSGKYKFSCWMGMVSGIIEVVDEKGLAKNSVANAQVLGPNNDDVIPSGARGCGCGGGSGSCGAR